MMPNFVLHCLIVASLGTAFVCSHASKPGHHQRVRGGQRVINGTRIPHSTFPFVVSIQANNASSGQWLHGCGGSIVNAVTILTACHCVAAQILGNTVSYGNHEIMRVVAGTGSLTRLDPTTQISRVKELIASPQCSNFPQYDDGWYGHDVGFVIVRKAFMFTPQVQPMRLYSIDMRESDEKLRQMISAGDTCYVPGWGITQEFTGTASEHLMVSKVNLITPERCSDLLCRLSQSHCYSHFDAIGQVCGVSQASSDCQGDSGGPLVCGGLVYGTVSYGERCLPGWPSVFQSIRPILELVNWRMSQNLGGRGMMKSAAGRGIALGRDAIIKQRTALMLHNPPLLVHKLGPTTVKKPKNNFWLQS